MEPKDCPLSGASIQASRTFTALIHEHGQRVAVLDVDNLACQAAGAGNCCIGRERQRANEARYSVKSHVICSDWY